jgi:hypothetical protein
MQDKENEKEWFFTFGVDHCPYNRKYVKIFGTYGVARGIMASYFGTKWAFQYGDIKDFKPEKYCCTELDLSKLIKIQVVEK